MKINDQAPFLTCIYSCLRTTTLPNMLALLLPTSPYSTLPQPTPPNTSLNYHYQNQSHCIIQDYIRSPASMNQSSYFCYNSLLAVNTCRHMFIIQSNGLIWCRKANFDCRDICKRKFKHGTQKKSQPHFVFLKYLGPGWPIF